jgi:hypothetical protein
MKAILLSFSRSGYICRGIAYNVQDYQNPHRVKPLLKIPVNRSVRREFFSRSKAWVVLYVQFMNLATSINQKLSKLNLQFVSNTQTVLCTQGKN